MALRREIRVGEQVLLGVVCELCPSRPALFPDAALAVHLRRHESAAAELTGALGGAGRGDAISGLDMRLISARPVARYRGGRPRGAKNRRSMSSTGVERKRGSRFYLR